MQDLSCTSRYLGITAAQTSDVQTLKDILYNAHDVRFEVRDDTPSLLYKEQEEEKWVPIRVLKDMSVDSDEEYDLDYIRSCKRICYFKRDKNEDPAVSIHHGKCKFPTPIAFRTRIRLKQTARLYQFLITGPHGSELAPLVLYCGVKISFIHSFYHSYCIKRRIQTKCTESLRSHTVSGSIPIHGELCFLITFIRKRFTSLTSWSFSSCGFILTFITLCVADCSLFCWL